MDKNSLAQVVEPALEKIGCFLVDLQITPDLDVTVTIEKEEGSVDMDDCIAVNDAVLAAFDRDEEDYSLTVTSAGLDQPFSMLRQYLKAVGSQVEARLKGGRKIIGELLAADEDSFTLKYQAMEAVEGKKKKVKVEKTERIALADANSVRYHIDMKG